MEDLIIKKTMKTPEILLQKNGDLFFQGPSIPENAELFYASVFTWLESFSKLSPRQITVTIDIFFLSTASAIIVMKILNFMKSMIALGFTLHIAWLYESDDEEVLEQGKMYENVLGIDFEFKTINTD